MFVWRVDDERGKWMRKSSVSFDIRNNMNVNGALSLLGQM
jgi:hypothetical protein